VSIEKLRDFSSILFFSEYDEASDDTDEELSSSKVRLDVVPPPTIL
jgi:hypothetical protein